MTQQDLHPIVSYSPDFIDTQGRCECFAITGGIWV